MSAKISYLLQLFAGKPVSLLSFIATRPTTALYPTNLRTVAFAFRTRATAAATTTKKASTAKKTSTAKKASPAKKASTAKKATTRKTTIGRRATAAKSKAKTRKSATTKKPVKRKVIKAATRKTTKRVAKSPVKKRAVPKRAAPKRARKVLTDEEKFLEKVKEARKQALRLPPNTTTTAYNMFCSESFLSHRPDGVKGFIPITGEPARVWHSMPQSERNKFEELAKKNNELRAANYKKSLQSYTVEEIQKANNARRWLKSKGIKRCDITIIKDPRKPARAMPTFMQFLRLNYDTLEGTTIVEKARAGGKAWNVLSDSDKKTYSDMFLAEKEKLKSQVNLTA